MNTNAASLPSSLSSRRIPLWDVFTALALIVMDLCWVTPTYALLIGRSLGESMGSAFLVFGVIYLASYLVANVRKVVDLYIGIIQVALLGVLILGVIWAASELLYVGESLMFDVIAGQFLNNLIRISIPLKPEFLLSITVFFFWRRGFTIANRNVGLGLIRKTFTIGSFALVGIGAISALFGRGLPYLEGGLFLFSSLLAMGGARLATLSSMRGGKGVAFKRGWVTGLTAIAALILSISVGVGYLAAGPLSTWIGVFVLAVEGYISKLLKIILAPLINVLGIIFAWFWSLFEPYQEQEVDPTTVEAFEGGLSGPVAEIQELGMNPQISSFLSTLGTVIGVLIIIGIVLYVVRRVKSDSTARPTEDEDRISIAGSLSDYLRSLQNRARQVLEGVTRMNPTARFIAAARIRIIYASLLRLSAQLGQARAPAVTPIEFMDSLEKIFPASREELETITHAYLRIRYGELPETRSQIEEVESAWKVVRKKG